LLPSLELVEVSRAECLQLLADERMGRVVFTEGALPAAWPVGYVLDGEEVVFRTPRTGRLAAATPGRVVAFEVDRVDPDTHTGWSVLGVGAAYEIVDPHRLQELTHRGPAPWSRRSDLAVAIPLHLLSGRRISVLDAVGANGAAVPR
jgi:nitroimidazol reductase NimA-like FMN-containing flavoprotein (pyridoxamine 5'-phosphate oxidase superfamily)